MRAPPCSAPGLAALETFEAEHGRVGPGDRMLVDCGWASRWWTPSYFASWPAMATELAGALVDRGVAVVAVDTASPDPVESTGPRGRGPVRYASGHESPRLGP